MPIPTMYKYIRSKDDILELIYETFLSEFRKELGNALSRRFPPKQQLAVALRATMTTFDRHHNEVKLLFRETKSLGDAARRRVYAQDQKYIEQWRNILIDAGVDSRLGIDAELLANFVHYLTTVWSMRHWAIGEWGLEEVQHALIRFVMAAATGDVESVEALLPEAGDTPATSGHAVAS
jgi:AcrR family transcriptional regulator